MSARRNAILIAAGIAVLTVAVYWQVGSFDFVEFDDPAYVSENPRVQQGLTWDNVRWALTTFEAGHWHPLTWLSLMATCQFFGSDAGAHHLVSVGIHVVAALLLFVALRRATGALSESAFVGALFALHPLRVESVAWVAERKDVLSALLWMLTLSAYVRYASKRSGRSYLLVIACFTLAVAAKPMVVTLPVVLLLIDAWPLRRWRFWRVDRRLIIEKLWFAPLVVLSVVLAVLAQHAAGAVAGLENLPVETRLATAAISYVRYVGKTLWPMHLVAFYPHPGEWPISDVVFATIGLAAMPLRFFCCG
jgi:hypothetical protein